MQEIKEELDMYKSDGRGKKIKIKQENESCWHGRRSYDRGPAVGRSGGVLG